MLLIDSGQASSNGFSNNLFFLDIEIRFSRNPNVVIHKTNPVLMNYEQVSIYRYSLFDDFVEKIGQKDTLP